MEQFISIYRNIPVATLKNEVILICKELSAISSLLEYVEEQTPVRAVTCSELRQELVFYKPGKGLEKA